MTSSACAHIRRSSWLPLTRALLLLFPLALLARLHLAPVPSFLSPRARTGVHAVARVARPADVATCVSHQISTIARGDILAAANAPAARARRRLAVLIRIFEGDFPYAISQLSWRYANRGRAEFDVYLIFDSSTAHARLLQHLGERGAGELAEAFTPLFLTSWNASLSYTRTPLGLEIEMRDGTTSLPQMLKTVLGWVATHPCYDYILVVDADSLILRPETLASAVEAKIARGLVFASIITVDQVLPVVYGTFRGIKDPKGKAHFDAFISNSTESGLLTTFFSDALAYDARDIPAFLRDIEQPRLQRWYAHQYTESMYDYWKLLRGEWRRVSGYVHYSLKDPDTTRGFIWKMTRGADWQGFLDAHGAAPMWVQLLLCKRTPQICLDDERISVVFNVDFGKHDQSFVRFYDDCFKVSRDVKAAFECALKQTRDPTPEFA